MPFVIKKFLDHGTSNPIVARLSMQILAILRDCNIAQGDPDKIGDLYLNSLLKKLLRCWEIKERFRQEFNAAAEAFKPPGARGQAIQIPQIARLEEECHNFLVEAKNFIRDTLKVFNILYGTDFEEASEFSRAKKGEQSLLEFAEKTFGAKDPKTQFLMEAKDGVEYLISLRNAVEHPGGFNGELRIENFALEPDGEIAEPTWRTEKDGQVLRPPSSIRADMDAALQNLLILAEDIFVSWAAEHLKLPEFMQVAQIAEERRDPKAPVKWVVTASQAFQERLAKLEQGRPPPAPEPHAPQPLSRRERLALARAKQNRERKLLRQQDREWRERQKRM